MQMVLMANRAPAAQLSSSAARSALRLAPLSRRSAARPAGRSNGVAVFALTGVPITFKVGPKKVENGERLLVVGNAKELGGWDVSRAPKLTWSAGDLWTGTVPLPLGQEVEFKFVISGTKEAVWESSANRTLAPDTPLAFIAQWDEDEVTTKEVPGDLVQLPEEDVPGKTPYDEAAKRHLKATIDRLVAEAISS